MLTNTFSRSYGRIDYVHDVSNRAGDKRTPNPQAYSIRRFRGGYRTIQWNQYSGDLKAYITDVNEPDTLVVPTDIAWILSGSEQLTPDWDRLRSRNLEKVFDKLRGNSEILVDLAESSQTLQMLKGVLTFRSSVSKFIKELATKPKKVRRIATTAAGGWLQYRYGWLPLMSSIYSAGENLRKNVFLRRIAVKARSTYSTEQRTVEVLGQPGTDAFKRIECEINQHCRHEYGFIFSLPSASTQQLLSWTSLNPLSIAWELVPFSFVVDWVVNVGDQLRAWENCVVFSNLYQGGYETLTLREERSAQYHLGIFTPTPQFWPDGSLNTTTYNGSRADASCVGYFAKKRRYELSQLPAPTGFRVKVDLNAKRVADLAALTSNKWKRFL